MALDSQQVQYHEPDMQDNTLVEYTRNEMLLSALSLPNVANQIPELVHTFDGNHE